MTNNLPPRDLLAEGLAQLGISPSDRITDTLFSYMELTLEKNLSLNLTAITDPAEFILKHYLDSLAICPGPVMQNAAVILDLGTGGGFPGIPLAVVFPEKRFVLVDSLNKRILFLQEACRRLGLENVTALHGRAEDLGRDKRWRESFDLCVSRAVAKLPSLSEYCLPFVKTGGWFAAYKTDGEDLSQGKKALDTLGGSIRQIAPFPVFSGPLSGYSLHHNIVYIQKLRPTPSSYPRKAGTPTKNPL